jgi:hypothetical protein
MPFLEHKEPTVMADGLTDSFRFARCNPGGAVKKGKINAKLECDGGNFLAEIESQFKMYYKITILKSQPVLLR